MNDVSSRWDRDRRNRKVMRFCGVDGEGGDIADTDALYGMRHAYQLLRAGEFAAEDPRGLSFQSCAEFLCALPRDRIYVAYFFDYDVTMMLRGIPEERARRIMDRDKRLGRNGVPLPVDIGQYQVDYMPHKEFKIRKAGQAQFLIISDVGQFFQTSFVKTLEKWDIGTAEQREMILKGKSMRADFTGMTPEIRAYNALEILLLEELMTQFRDVCIDVGYLPQRWQGPGWLASSMMRQHGIPKRKDISIMYHDEFRELANEAYYGGRFETTAVGPVRGPVYQYDINSAYPAALRTLPCLVHGSWKRIRNIPDHGSVWFGRIYFSHHPDSVLCNLPIRTKEGNIYYPVEGNGVYWSTEISAAMDAGTRCSLSEGWVYEGRCDCRWFDFIDEYYARRLALGKTTKGFVLKLAGNSLYGKIAQSIGSAPYANPVWAGLITAHCRASLARAYKDSPQSVVMLATDGIFATGPLALPVSQNLGEWDLTIHEEGIFVVQPGIYFTSRGDVKSRGVERGRINKSRDIFEAAWERVLESNNLDHTVPVSVDNFITCRQALARGKWAIAGTWEHEVPRELSYSWASKRAKGTNWRDEAGNYRTDPLPGSTFLMSRGYTRVIGGEIQTSLTDPRYNDPGLLEKERMDEQPDWVEPLIESLSDCYHS